MRSVISVRALASCAIAPLLLIAACGDDPGPAGGGADDAGGVVSSDAPCGDLTDDLATTVLGEEVTLEEKTTLGVAECTASSADNPARAAVAHLEADSLDQLTAPLEDCEQSLTEIEVAGADEAVVDINDCGDFDTVKVVALVDGTGLTAYPQEDSPESNVYVGVSLIEGVLGQKLTQEPPR